MPLDKDFFVKDNYPVRNSEGSRERRMSKTES